jgi:hypothetical protein
VTYFAPGFQLLLLVTLGDFFPCVLLAGDFALVEAGEVFFAGRGVEFDLLGGGYGDPALLGGRRHGEYVRDRLAVCRYVVVELRV